MVITASEAENWRPARAWTPVGSPLRLRRTHAAQLRGTSQHFEDGLRILDSRLAAFVVSDAHLIPDDVLRDLALDVHEQLHVAAHLVGSPYRRALLSNARAAVESAIDAIVLTHNEAEYDRRGADAYVFGMLELEQLDRRLGLEETRLLGQSKGLEERMGWDATAWNNVAPGKGSFVTRAFEQFPKRSEERQRHWSGMSNREIHTLVSGTLPNWSPESAGILDGLYALLSIHTHPRPRFGHRVRGDARGGRTPAVVEAEEPAMIYAAAQVALSLAIRALDARWRFKE